jgi:amino acid adenylation domain-containing protein
MKLINLVQNFSYVVEKQYDQIAIIDGQGSLSFSDLLEYSKRLANEISNNLSSSNNLIAVYLPKSRYAIIADIGIMYSGNAFMNLDIKSPIPRVKAVIDNTKPSIIVTDDDNLTKLQSTLAYDTKVISISGIDQWDSSGTNWLKYQQKIDTDPCCVINTSGSTGIPKSVVLNHRSFIDFLSWSIDTFYFNERTTIGSLSPAVFDIYCFELCLLLYCGSRLVLIPESLSAFPVRILEWLSEYAINFIFWVPTIMVNIANMRLLDSAKLDGLNLVWFAGEVLPTKHLNYWCRMLPSATFVNMYGPIEITLDCLYYLVDKELQDDEPIPIGRACRNTDILILREDGSKADIDEQGELCVRGSSLAMGYYNDPQKTSIAFTQNPLQKHFPELIYRTGDIVYMRADGDIMFIGRKDHQIKHQGYRIELSEIESVVLHHNEIRNACVVYDSNNKSIQLFYESDKEIAVRDMRQFLGKRVPKYMIPNEFIRVEQMPMNTNGKIDRKMLLKFIEGASNA